MNSAAAPLRHLVFAKRGHPEELFAELSRLAGALCTFKLDSHSGDLPPYDHQNLSTCFSALDQHIREHLDIIVPNNCISIPLNRASDYFYDGEISDQRCLGRSQCPDDAAASQMLSNVLQAKIVTRQMAQNFRLDNEGHLETSVEKMLEDPIINVEQALRGALPAELNAGAKGLCSQFRAVTSKFPFNPTAKTEATLAEVNALFRKPDGGLWSMYEKSVNKVLSNLNNAHGGYSERRTRSVDVVQS